MILGVQMMTISYAIIYVTNNSRGVTYDHEIFITQVLNFILYCWWR